MKIAWIILIINGVLFSYPLKAQMQMYDIFTPHGNPVITYQMTEATNKERSDFDLTYITAYPNATPIYTYPPYSSTRLFNCHGYA